MHEMKEKLIKAGTDILNASKTELYVSMRFLDIALNSLGYEMDLSMKTIGTDSQKIRFNPRYLIENYQRGALGGKAEFAPESKLGGVFRQRGGKHGGGFPVIAAKAAQYFF